MSYYPKYLNYVFWKPETAFRTNAHGKDAANEAGDTFYTLPIIKPTMSRIIPLRRRLSRNDIAGRTHYGFIGFNGIESGTFTLSGELHDGTMLKHMLHPNTYSQSVNTPSAGYYTRSMREDVPTDPYSFELLIYNLNPVSGDNVITLLHGCVVKSCTISRTGSNQIQCTMQILVASYVTGVALTSLPSTPHIRTYDSGLQSTVTWNISGSPVNAVIYDFRMVFDSGAMFLFPGGDAYASEVSNGPRNWTVEFDAAHKDKDFWSDTLETADPATDDDMDITIKLARDTTYDYIQFAFEKMWVQSHDTGDYILGAFNLQHHYTFIMKPVTLASGAKCTISEVINVGYPS